MRLVNKVAELFLKTKQKKKKLRNLLSHFSAVCGRNHKNSNWFPGWDLGHSHVQEYNFDFRQDTLFSQFHTYARRYRYATLSLCPNLLTFPPWTSLASPVTRLLYLPHSSTHSHTSFIDSTTTHTLKISNSLSLSLCIDLCL